MMIVSRLLKSWATPPVSWPMPSIFCAWRARSSAARLSVRSRVILAKPSKLPYVVLDRIDEDARPKPGPILADPPVFRFELAGLAGNGQRLVRHVRCLIFRGVERAKVPSENFCARVALDALGAGVPVDDVTRGIEHINRVIVDALDQKPESSFGVFKFAKAGRQLPCPFVSALFQGLIERP